MLAQTARHPLKLDDIARIRDVRDPQVSPDGQWVVLTATPGILKTLDVPLLRGRGFDPPRGPRHRRHPGRAAGVAAMGAYVASKSAVIRLTETMAAELREKNINVNCVLPTIIDTPENRAATPGVDPARWVAPGDLARVFVFLASEEARAIHGAAVLVPSLS